MKQEDVWALQIVYMFLDKYDYRLISTGPNAIKDEIWLANPKGKYPVIRVSTLSTTANYFDYDRLVKTKQAILSLISGTGLMLSLHISNETTDKIYSEIYEVCISESYLSDELIKEDYPAITSIIQPISDPQKEYEDMSKAINVAQIKGYRKGNSWVKAHMNTTYVIMAICIGMFVVSLLLTQFTGSKLISAVMSGALYKTFVYANLDLWRLLMAGFVHVDYMHLLVNMYSLYHLGPTIERLYGRKNYIKSLLGSIVIGSAFALVGSVNTITVGISGGLFGLLGMLFIYAFETNSIRDRRVMGSFVQIFIINIVIMALVPNISWLGHAGGFVAGVLFGLIFSKKPTWELLRKNTIVASVVLIIALSFMAYNDERKRPIDPTLDKGIINSYDRLNISWYAEYLESNLVAYYKTVR